MTALTAKIKFNNGMKLGSLSLNLHFQSGLALLGFISPTFLVSDLFFLMSVTFSKGLS